MNYSGDRSSTRPTTTSFDSYQFDFAVNTSRSSGQSWSSSAPSSGIEIPQANNPSLFSDLVGSALGSSSHAQSNAPLRSASHPPARPHAKHTHARQPLDLKSTARISRDLRAVRTAQRA